MRLKESDINMTTNVVSQNFWATVSWRWRALGLACLMLVLMALTGCSKTIDSAWREEVQLGDGSVIVIRRSVKYETGKAFPGKGNYVDILENKYYFPPAQPGGKEVVFDGYKRRNWSTMLVDRSMSTGDWLIVQSMGECNYAKKTRIYIQKNYINGVWVEQPSVSAELYGRDRNLEGHYLAVPPVNGGLVTVSVKAEEIAASKKTLRGMRTNPVGDVIFSGEDTSCNGAFVE
jgi:hypothetical protein